MGSVRGRATKVGPTTMGLLLAFVSVLPAQDRRPLDDRRTEGDIEAFDVMALSFHSLEIAPEIQARVFELPTGGWGVTSTAFGGEIQLFDVAGNPSGTLGRRGQGPGEFGGPVFGIATPDKLLVVDPRNQRMSTFSPELALIADRRISGRIFWAAQANTDDAVIVSGSVGNGDHGASIGRIALTEDLDRFSGDLEDHARPRAQVDFAAETPIGEIWTVASSGGAVNVLRGNDLSSRERLRLPMEETLLEAPLRLDITRERPVAQVVGVMADQEGVVWVVVISPDEQWRPGLSRSSGLNMFFDTLVFAIDAASRTVIGEERFDVVCQAMGRQGLSCVDELGETVRLIGLSVRTPGN